MDIDAIMALPEVLSFIASRAEHGWISPDNLPGWPFGSGRAIDRWISRDGWPYRNYLIVGPSWGVPPLDIDGTVAPGRSC